MFSSVLSAGLQGIDSYIVQVETDISEGMPRFELVGYLGSEVREARERVRAALKNTGFYLPVKRITVNLAPANIRKQGTGFDLSVAISILLAMEKLSAKSMADTVIIGELLLSGQVSGVWGILPIVLAAKQAGYKRCIVPGSNAAEGAVVDGMELIGVESLKELVDYLLGGSICGATQGRKGVIQKNADSPKYDLKNVQGQHFAKRGLEIAASGLHNVIMTGEPGAGKTMLAKCIPTILPPLSHKECLEVSAIYSVAGRLNAACSLVTERPFISPHHTITDTALVGGGSYPRPGSISMAHKGVLFLDEMPEFSKRALEALRQPLEEKEIHVLRSYGSCVYPADFMLVGAMNSCPCGAYPNLEKCTCTEAMRKKYLGKLSRPLLDRMDICMEVSQVSYGELVKKQQEESSETVRKRVMHAQGLQQERFLNYEGRILFNSQMGAEEIEKFCSLRADGKRFMEQIFEKLSLSARAYHRLLKVARTIADLDGAEQIDVYHLSEAVHFRFNL